MSKNHYAIIIQFVLPLTTFYRSGVQRSNVYKRDAVTSWRSHNRAWQPRRHDRLSETSGTLWIHRGALTNQRCSLATGCGIIYKILVYILLEGCINGKGKSLLYVFIYKILYRLWDGCNSYCTIVQEATSRKMSRDVLQRPIWRKQ